MHDLREWLPAHEWSSRHHRVVAAPVAVSARCILDLEDSDMPVTRALMGARQLPARFAARGAGSGAGPGSADGYASLEPDLPSSERMRRLGFVVLRESDEPGVGVSAGFVGRPWQLTLKSAVVRGLDPASFLAFDESGYIKAVTSMWAEPRHDGTSRLMTGTYIHATDREAARRFGRYWLAIKAFSGLTRMDMLRGIARRAEREAVAATTSAGPAGAASSSRTADPAAGTGPADPIATDGPTPVTADPARPGNTP
ncbi:hypothetical protein [Streptodolium elevatio]|uniref:Uncharacterized protein n=1 Tax=Streptodolium elevatio TaxID=3157996 RepID=A0ABV3DAL4_9ACTN